MQRETRCKKNSYLELFWSVFFPKNPGKMRTRITPNTGSFYAVKLMQKENLWFRKKSFPHYCNSSFLRLPSFAILSWFTKIKSQKIKNKNNDYISKKIFSYDKVYKEFSIGHLSAQSQQGKNWSNVWNLLKVKRH